MNDIQGTSMKLLRQSQATTKAIEAINDKLIHSSTKRALANTMMSFHKGLKSMAKSNSASKHSNTRDNISFPKQLSNRSLFALNKVQNPKPKA